MFSLYKIFPIFSFYINILFFIIIFWGFGFYKNRWRKKECENLYYFPQRKRVVPELQQIGILKYKEIIYERWRIIFKIDNTKVYVLLVVDSRRNLEDILFQRLIDKK